DRDGFWPGPSSRPPVGAGETPPRRSLPAPFGFPSRTPPLPRSRGGKTRAEVMAKSCKGLAMELVKCLSETDCVKVQKRPYKECAGEKVPNITSECVGLRETYFNCKRGQA
ncbi:hypothetical protein U9M48_014917, partial [Paspalum notatum var. saurae]